MTRFTNIALKYRLASLRPIFSPLRRLPPLSGGRATSSVAASTCSLAKAVTAGEGKASGSPSLPEGAVTPRSVDFNAWYLDVIANAELGSNAPVKGTMNLTPYSYAIWKHIQDYMNVKCKEIGHRCTSFSQLIPYSFIEKEASHVEGFSPELALVTIRGRKTARGKTCAEANK